MPNTLRSLRASAPLALAAAAIVGSSPAEARRVVVDGSVSFESVTPCALGGACTALDLGFNIRVNGALTNQLFFYDNGIVALGQALAIGSPPASLAAAGGNVFSAAYSGAALTNSRGGSGTDQTLNLPVYRFEFVPDPLATTTLGFSIYQLNGGGDFRLEFGYGRGTDFGEPDPPDVLAESIIGYAFGPLVFETTAGAERQGDPNRIDDPVLGFSFDFRSGAAPIPEPTTWVTMIAGFVLLGAAMRVRRRSSISPA